MKQVDANLTIYDVKTKEITTVEDFSKPSAFIFLYLNRLFLTFRDTQVAAFNFQGEKATTFADHELFHNETSTNNNYISEDQTMLISYCRNKDKGTGIGSVNISNCITGELVHKLDAVAEVSGGGGGGGGNSSSSSSSSGGPDAEAMDVVDVVDVAFSDSGAEIEVHQQQQEDTYIPGAEYIYMPGARPRAMTIVSRGQQQQEEPSTRPSRSLSDAAVAAAAATHYNNVVKADQSNQSLLDQLKRTEALDGVTAIFFNDDYSELYTGNDKGQVWVWGH